MLLEPDLKELQEKQIQEGKPVLEVDDLVNKMLKAPQNATASLPMQQQ